MFDYVIISTYSHLPTIQPPVYNIIFLKTLRLIGLYLIEIITRFTLRQEKQINTQNQHRQKRSESLCCIDNFNNFSFLDFEFIFFFFATLFANILIYVLNLRIICLFTKFCLQDFVVKCVIIDWIQITHNILYTANGQQLRKQLNGTNNDTNVYTTIQFHEWLNLRLLCWLIEPMFIDIQIRSSLTHWTFFVLIHVFHEW